MDKDAIIKNFSRYAHLYDEYADVQKMAASKLLSEIKTGGFEKILEIGCGTGNYTLLLRENFINAELKAVDISKRMIEVAHNKLNGKEAEFIAADAEAVKFNEDFDLITSNACFQWFDDLEAALVKYKNSLKKRGVISFSVFGPLTFQELSVTLKHFFKDISISASNFINREKIAQILNKNFKETEIKEITHLEFLPSLKALLNKIKYTGTRGVGLNGKVSFSPKMLRELEQLYLEKFARIQATYQIFFCQAKKI